MDAAETTVAAPSPTWALMPVLDAVDYTLQAVEDLLQQTVPMRVLIIDQGSTKATNDRLRQLAEGYHPKVLLWSFNPALPSLSAAWNAGLDFCWDLGEEEVLVVNNDVRLHQMTVKVLQTVRVRTKALFVSTVGVREPQFDPTADVWTAIGEPCLPEAYAKGGPDFSCFLLSREGHRKYRFDEGFIPAYNEDLDMHRRYMLGGDGDKIFSINLPFLHFASRTINVMTPESRASWEKRRNISREYYLRKWGGGANSETFRVPFGQGEYPAWLTAALLEPGQSQLQTTPELQAYWRIKPMGSTF